MKKDLTLTCASNVVGKISVGKLKYGSDGQVGPIRSAVLKISLVIFAYIKDTKIVF